MFEYSKIKADLEEIKCPVHGKAATVKFENGRMVVENVCCPKHQEHLDKQLPEIEDPHDVADILEDVY